MSDGQVVPGRRIDYAGSVHDEREITAVVEVLRGGPTALRIGRNVRAMEARVAELFGKRRGVILNYGTFQDAAGALDALHLPGSPDDYDFASVPDGDLPLYLFDWNPADEEFVRRDDS